MEVKKDILWRVYLAFIGIVVFSMVIIGKVVYIQQVEGSHWIAQANEQQQRMIEIQADRGTIYSEDGSMLSTSIPYFDIYIDFGAEGLRAKDGANFREHLDSLSYHLAALFGDRSKNEYKKRLQAGYRKKERYHLLKRNLSFQQYKTLREFPLVNLGRNKSGFIAEVKHKRLNPYQLLANRTIGLSRDFVGTDGKKKNNNVGLEKTYEDVLRGETGSKLVRYLAGGVYVPIEGYEVEPQHGKDIITTLNVNIQDIAETALLRMMKENEAVHGTCVVMETSTGKIKAIANLGRQKDGSYWEDLNYALRTTEPGSTFKLATLLALIEDGKVGLNEKVDLEKGRWKVSTRTVFDSEQHGRNLVTVKEAFEYSSNVGMAKLVQTHYSKDPMDFVDHLRSLRLHEPSGIDIVGEGDPVIKTPSSKTWSKTTLPWMSFGYEVLVSPLQTLMLYNAVANDGKMMKPYLVNAVRRSGLVVKEFTPQVIEDEICSESTLQSLRSALEGVCGHEGGTGYNLFKDAPYRVAGKTGTALVANGKRGYADRIYQSSFAGYFPAENPKYSMIVVIKNKPFAKKFYGGSVAGPVFKEVADKLYALEAEEKNIDRVVPVKIDSSDFYYAGFSPDMKEVMSAMHISYQDSAGKAEWAGLKSAASRPVLKVRPIPRLAVPDVRGMGLKDALYLLEDAGLKVNVTGSGKVVAQSLQPGTGLVRKQNITIELN